MEYTKTKIMQDTPYELYLVHQGGKEIAYFKNEQDADEYIEFLTLKNK